MCEVSKADDASQGIRESVHWQENPRLKTESGAEFQWEQADHEDVHKGLRAKALHELQFAEVPGAQVQEDVQELNLQDIERTQTVTRPNHLRRRKLRERRRRRRGQLVTSQ